MSNAPVKLPRLYQDWVRVQCDQSGASELAVVTVAMERGRAYVERYFVPEMIARAERRAHRQSRHAQEQQQPARAARMGRRV